MVSKKRLKVLYGLIIYLFLVGVLCYAAFPVKPPAEPIRIMYRVTAGNVLFDHQRHTAQDGYALSCFDCHHHPPYDDASLIACGECHTLLEGGEQPAETCLDCHDMDEIEDTPVPKRSDAFHASCIQCHQDFEAGPAECSACHVMP